MTAYRHAWKPGDEAWVRYFDLAADGYVPRLEGIVTAVGTTSITIRRSKPNWEGKFVERVGFHDVWPSKESIEAAIALKPSPLRPRAPREK